MKVSKIYVLICWLLLVETRLTLAAPPVLYPNFPLFIGPSSETMMPKFGTILAEIDTFPGAEIVLHSAVGYLHVWDYQGISLSGFPKPQTPFPYGGSSVGDLNGDGKNEIVNITKDGWLDIIDNQGKSWPNFPLSTPIVHTSAPVLADLNNDGQKEIIFYYVWGKDIYVYRLDGTIFPGWPKTIKSAYTPGFVRGSPAVGDLDGDGYKEIVALAFDSVYVWRYTGELVEGWPVAAIDTVYTQYMDDCSPLLADLNKDGKLEIVAARSAGNPDDFPNISGVIEVYSSNGEMLPGWPKHIAGATIAGPVAGDLDKEGSLEIVVYTWRYINILKPDGEFYPGWPLEVDWVFEHQPILADVDNNDTMEIVFIKGGNAITGSEVFAYTLSGKLLDGYPFHIEGFPSLNAPAIGDVDNSDSLSLLIVTEWGQGFPPELYAYIYLYDLGVPYKPSSVQWGTYGHNNRRTNNYHDNDICLAKPGDATGDTIVDFSDIIKIVDYLFRGDTLSGPRCSLDPNFDRKIKLSDVVYLINYLFKAGIPPIPYDDCCVGN